MSFGARAGLVQFDRQGGAEPIILTLVTAEGGANV